MDLNQAITAVDTDYANGVSGDTITFSLPCTTISLPNITLYLTAPNTTIDGANGQGAPGVAIDPTPGFVGLDIQSNGNTIRHLATAGLRVEGDHNMVIANYLGTDLSGTTSLGSNDNGVEVTGSSNSITGNLIAGNSLPTHPSPNAAGIFVYGGAGHNVITGNSLGVGSSGAALANDIGVYLFDVGGDTVGGARSAVGDCATPSAGDPCNLISGNNETGVVLDGVTGTTVEGNFIGAAASGTKTLPNGSGGIQLNDGAAQNTIGGGRALGDTACDGACNLVSGNALDGVALIGQGTSSNQVLGNYLGTDSGGKSALPNRFDGVAVFGGATQNTVGGSRAAGDTACDSACNLIGGNNNHGILVADPGTDGNLVQGNYIGVNNQGTAALPNGLDGVAVFHAATHTTVGGQRAGSATACDGTCNLISGNSNHGVLVADAGTDGTLVEGNTIGTVITGTAALPNSFDGIAIFNGATNTTVGGARAAGATSCDGPCNLVSGNSQSGIYVSDAATTRISVLNATK
jgi:hypothetical protein